MDGHPNGTGTGGRPLSLVIPAFNEEAVIGRAIQEADEALTRLGGDYEILVVDDGSRDNTAWVVAAAALQRPRVRLLRHVQNRGYSAALRTGFEAAQFDHVAFTDADCQFDLADLAPLLELSGHFPLAAGYRLDRQDPPLRRLISWGYNLVVRTLLGTRVRDCDCALKVFRKEALANILPETRGFFGNTEMLTRARQLGYQVAEVGVRHRPRQGGVSKVSLRDIPRTLATLVPFWWSRVLFPGHGSDPASRGGPPAWRLQAFLITLLMVMAGLLFFARLRCPLLEPEEARYAEIPREMLDEGRFLIPVYHGEPYYHKPPLLYWLVMASYRLFGVHDWAARIIPCGAAFLTVLVAYGWGRRTVGDRAAFLGALILCLSARFVYFGRMLSLDSLLCLCVISALAAAHVALQGGTCLRRWWYLSAACCGLGLLSKGPVALVLVGLPVLAYPALDPRAGRPGWRGWLGYGAVVVGLACPWFVLVACQDPAFAGYFFWTHNVIRYLAPYDHVRPAWFYLPGLVLGMLPWTLLVLPLARFLARRPAAWAARRPPALGFFLLAFLACMAFFSLSACKRSGYILPAFPPLALALGCYLDAVLPRSARGKARGPAYTVLLRSPGPLAYRATLLVLALGCGGSVLAVAAGIWKPVPGLVLAGLSAGGCGGLIRAGRRRRPWVSSWALCGATTFALLFVAIHQILPGYARKFSLRGQVRRHLPLARDARISVYCYPHRWDSVSFYLRRRDVGVFTPDQHRQMLAALQNQPDCLVFVKSDGDHQRPLTDLLGALPPALEFVPCGRPGTVTAGIIRRRPAVPEFLLAQR
jgi:dolichol-phosphate mannosyltransferase